MKLWNRNGLQWTRGDALFFAACLGLLLLHPLLNGYPFLFGDSWAYCAECPDSTRSPVLGCATRPLVAAAGIWGYVVFQCAAVAFAFTVLSGAVFQRRDAAAVLAAIVVSGAGIFAGWVLADVWTLAGLICLFVVSSGCASPPILLLLAFALATHFGNFPVFTAAALGFLPFVRERLKFALRVAVCILVALALVVASNLIGGTLKFTSGNGPGFLASRMLHDFPELIEDVCRDRPGFGLCRHKAEVLHWSQADPGSFMWIFVEELRYGAAEFDRLSRELVLYSLSKFPGYYPRHLAAAVRNTFGLLSFYEISDGHTPYAVDPYVFETMQPHFPGQGNRYRESPQGAGRLQALLKAVEMPLTALFWLSAVAGCAYAAARRRSLGDDPLARFAVFALIAVFANAFFMSTISGVFGRYHARLGFLLIFPGIAFAARGLRALAQRALRHPPFRP
jgi:hypothetical protein